MTDEELKKELDAVNEKLAGLGPEEKLSNAQWRQQQQLKREKDLLLNIQKARQNNDTRGEAKHMTGYTLLKNNHNMNPFLRYLMQLKLRSQIWS
jgi:hypothetical protein